VPLALVALQAADSRLARLDRPQWLPLRKALASDVDRLRALPLVDTVGVSLRLEQVAASVDRLPLAMDARPREVRERGGEAAPLPWWQRAGAEAWQALRGLVRIERFDAAAPELLEPGQVFFLRENLRLRLLNARLALLSRDQAAFRNDLKLTVDWLERYFDGRDKAVQNALASLRQLQGGEINVALPNLGDTQTALRALRNGKDKR
jgi:uroporphyrin-3 C-methyltransferase